MRIRNFLILQMKQLQLSFYTIMVIPPMIFGPSEKLDRAIDKMCDVQDEVDRRSGIHA